jgi:hypothetical protein
MNESTLTWAITWTTYCEGGVKQVSNIKAYKAYASTEPDGTINIGIHSRGAYLEDCYYIIPPKDTESGPLGIRFKGAGASQKDGGDPRVVVLLRDRNLVPAALAAVREHLTVQGLTDSGVIEIDAMLQTGVRRKLDWSKGPGPEIANASDNDPSFTPDEKCERLDDGPSVSNKKLTWDPLERRYTCRPDTMFSTKRVTVYGIIKYPHGRFEIINLQVKLSEHNNPYNWEITCDALRVFDTVTLPERILDQHVASYCFEKDHNPELCGGILLWLFMDEDAANKAKRKLEKIYDATHVTLFE